MKHAPAWLAAASVTTIALVGSAQPAAPPPNPYPPNLQAGGLVPPPPMSDAAARSPSATEQSLDEAKQRDARRGLHAFSITADGGFEHLGVQALHAGDPALAAGFGRTTASGAFTGGSLAYRFLFFSVAARGQIGLLAGLRELTVGGEAALRLPFGAIEPSVTVGAGYASLGGFVGANGEDTGASMSGLYARAVLGLDYFIVPAFSIGVRGGVDLLSLSRAALDATKTQALTSSGAVTAAQASALAAAGSSLGGSVLAGAEIGLHF